MYVVPTAAIVPAAGRGERLGPGVPKALRELAGEPLLVHAVRSLWSAGCVDLVVVAAPPGSVAAVEATLLVAVEDLRLVVVEGGGTRQASVAAGLSAVPGEFEIVLVHDAARALVPAEVVVRVVDAVRAGAGAVVPVLPVTDTIKQVDADRVVATVDRSSLRSVQTPQGFARLVLESAHSAGHRAAGHDATDDASLVEAMGGEVVVVEGSAEAFKVTRPLDLALAEAVLRSRPNAP